MEKREGYIVGAGFKACKYCSIKWELQKNFIYSNYLKRSIKTSC